LSSAWPPTTDIAAQSALCTRMSDFEAVLFVVIVTLMQCGE
jgi:hypothetical protein